MYIEPVPKGFGPYFVPSPDVEWNNHLFVVVLPLDVIDRLVIAARHHAAHIRPNPHDNRGENMFYAAVDKERVGLIRHCLINRTRADSPPRGYPRGYDNLLFRIGLHGEDVEARQLDLKLTISRLIGTHYPELARECEYQRWLLTR